jgi:CsoR family transcriptional regulator, copper-sensing transcriptional repressor
MNNEPEISENKRQLLTRLGKIKGQIKGIQRMIESEIPCVDVLVQISAARSALNNVGILLFESYAKECLLDSVNSEEAFDETKLDDFLVNIQKFLKYNT